MCIGRDQCLGVGAWQHARTESARCDEAASAPSSYPTRLEPVRAGERNAHRYFHCRLSFRFEAAHSLRYKLIKL